ncbi:hypothetical protein NDU88_005031 [Pleurodeles waltl]|uniref:Uncharacterized protein n=1 Tax=Pleurodeles waltl TaxID=8319 RepID=A0AAV7VIS3_PLEWA|nr:hypothetical protein NDU88_005031 [Pleurodeles waltl]
MPPSPHMSQRTVPMKDNSKHRVKQLRGQRPPEKKYLVCHRQGRPDPGGTHCRKRWEDIRRWRKKTAEAQLGMASQRGRGARRTMTPPDVQDPGGGVPGVGWALEGITAATRG